MEWLKGIPIISHLLLAENAGMTFLEAIPILQNGILACLLTALMSAFLGVYVIVKRIVFASAALSQISALGVAFAFLAGTFLGSDLGEGVHHTMPLLFSGVAAGFLALQTGEKKITREGLLGIGYIVPSGLVLLILDKIAGETHEIDDILFGNTVFVPTWQIFFLLLTALVVLAIHLIFYKEFIFVAFDPDSARAAGLRTVLLNQIFFLTIAVTISVSISAVGALPVFGFMVIPAAGALMLTDRLKTAFFLSVSFGVLSALAGFYLSFLYSLPTGPAMLGTAAFFLIPGMFRRVSA
ncbi:MAG: metal ABC transporter permease [Nitrospiria bacterium]